MKKKQWLLVVMIMMFCIMSALPAYAASVRKVVLSQKKIVVYVGKKEKLTAVVKPAGAVNAKIKWSSKNKKIATVSSKGVVKGKKKGTTYIVAKTANGKKAVCKVTVKKYVKPTKVKLNQTTLSMNEGDSITLKATVLPKKATDKTVQWTSSDPSVVAVSNGTLNALKGGTATITVKTVNGKTKSCKVTVAPKVVVNTTGGDSFMQNVAAMTKKAAEEGTAGMSTMETGYSRRLIVKSLGAALDFSAFNPEKVIASNDGVYFVQFTTVSAANKAFDSLSNDSRVKYVEYDEYLQVDDLSISKAGEAKSWGVEAIGADVFAEFVAGKTSSSIVVAVIDTGVSSTHSFLSGRIASGGYDLVDNDSVANDANGHGTHVSGTVVDCTPGLSVKILPIRVLDERGSGSSGNVANGIYYAVRQGAEIINLSLGGGRSNYVDEAILYAVQKGVTVVCAAGNENSSTSGVSPAHLEECIVVAACNDSDQKAHFSNYGTSVDVIAPGVEIISAYPGNSYRTMNGTSMASPHVAGLVAMVKLLYPAYTPAEVENFIEKYTTDLGSTGYDIYYGNGRPDMQKALDVLDIQPSISLSGSVSSGKAYITATTVPAGQQVSWKSSNTGVATVSGGTVTAVSSGTTTITASMTYKGKTYTATKTVTVGSTTSYGEWSAWTRTKATASATQEVQTTPLYRYYYYECSACGGHKPLWSSSTCSTNQSKGENWRETWSPISYANSGSAVISGLTYKRYTYNLGDGQKWIFSAGNLNATAIGTIDANSSAQVIQQGYRTRQIYTGYQVTACK